MAGVNKVILLGRIGKNPEIASNQNSMVRAKFSLATSKKMKDGQEKTEWHSCIIFGKGAETIEKYVHKGDQLYVEGELNYNKYEKDGDTKYYTSIFVTSFSFIGNKQTREYGTNVEANTNTNNQQNNNRQNNGQSGGQNQALNNKTGEKSDTFNDDIPF